MKRFQLEDRIINFAVSVVELCRQMKHGVGAKYFADQLLRSACSSALNYSEAQAAESKRDFIHKLSIVLKELRETHTCLRILTKLNLIDNEYLTKECNELISILVKSVQTLKM